MYQITACQITPLYQKSRKSEESWTWRTR
uniref:Uncharacterized protein n=1 Tax=Anguilla anguilla TaxID=7936 RepID=A0A0E9ULZ3_ANGAN